MLTLAVVVLLTYLVEKKLFDNFCALYKNKNIFLNFLFFNFSFSQTLRFDLFKFNIN